MEPLFSPLIEQAVELAAQWHEGTYRKGMWRAPAFRIPEEAAELRVPVMAHVTAVALVVQRAGFDDVTVAAAFLHDTLEDANRHGQALRRETLAEAVGPAVVRLVEVVSEQKRDAEGASRSWQARKDDYVAQLRRGPAEAAAISLADKLHNLWSMNESLARGLDVFADGPGRRALSAGPEAQRRFYRAVLDATAHHADARLVPLRQRLEAEMARFHALAGLPG